MIEVVIFDVGNVLLKFNPREAFREHFNEDVYEQLIALMFEADYWNAYDRGSYTREELTQIFIRTLPHLEKEIHLAMRLSIEMLQPITQMLDYAKQLQTMYRVSILSNMPKEIETHILEKYPFFMDFELPMYSHRVKLIKPEPEIYEMHCKWLGVSPKVCLFVDDRIENILQARALGMHAVQMQEPTQTIQEIQLILGANT